MKKKLQNLRENAVKIIVDLMTKHNINEINFSDFVTGCSPVVSADRNCDFTMTLDHISLSSNGKLEFDGSSCWENNTWSIDELPTDTLVETAEFLQENEDQLEELVTAEA